MTHIAARRSRLNVAARKHAKRRDRLRFILPQQRSFSRTAQSLAVRPFLSFNSGRNIFLTFISLSLICPGSPVCFLFSFLVWFPLPVHTSHSSYKLLCPAVRNSAFTILLLSKEHAEIGPLYSVVCA